MSDGFNVDYVSPDKAVSISLVKLTSGEYEVPKGTIGYIDQIYDAKDEAIIGFVNEGIVGPIQVSDLEPLGSLTVSVPKDDDASSQYR
jgi:hypothetical protein